VVDHPYFGQVGGSATPLAGLEWPNHPTTGKKKLQLMGFGPWRWTNHPQGPWGGSTTPNRPKSHPLLLLLFFIFFNFYFLKKIIFKKKIYIYIETTSFLDVVGNSAKRS
jgi:hypothetical protein